MFVNTVLDAASRTGSDAAVFESVEMLRAAEFTLCDKCPIARSSDRRRHVSTLARTLGSWAQRNAVRLDTLLSSAHLLTEPPLAMVSARLDCRLESG